MDSFPCGTVVKDKEGKRWIMLASNATKRWERIIDKFPYCQVSDCLVSSENYQVYEVHDNGGRPFDVIVTVNKIFIVANQEDIEPCHILTITDYKRIFIGQDTGIPGSEGNSILVYTKEGDYIYIGERIYRFHTESPVKEYYSPIGGNDVPNPYAVTETRVYLLSENVTIDRKGLTMYSTYENIKDTPGDPYETYYEYGGKKVESTPFKYEEISERSNSTASLFNIWKSATAPYRNA